KTVCYISLFLFLHFSVRAQKSLAVFTPSPYGLGDQLIIVQKKNSEKIKIPAKELEIMDNRFDNSKQGFFPVYKTAPRLIVFEQNLADWFQSHLSSRLDQEQQDSTRKLLFV